LATTKKPEIEIAILKAEVEVATLKAEVETVITNTPT
jgi:hypothetical protein